MIVFYSLDIYFVRDEEGLSFLKIVRKFIKEVDLKILRKIIRYVLFGWVYLRVSCIMSKYFK